MMQAYTCGMYGTTRPGDARGSRQGEATACMRSELARHFEAREIAALTALIAMINLWNRIQVAQH